MPPTWRKVLLLHVIGSEGSASASENRASEFHFEPMHVSASPDHVPIREPQSAADLPVSFAGGSSIVSGLPLEMGTVKSQR